MILSRVDLPDPFSPKTPIFCAVVKRKRDVFDDLFAVDGLGDAHHGVNDLRIAHDAASRISASLSSSKPRNSYM